MSLRFQDGLKNNRNSSLELDGALEIRRGISGYRVKPGHNTGLPATALIYVKEMAGAAARTESGNNGSRGIPSWLVIDRGRRGLIRALKQYNKGKEGKARAKLLRALQRDEDLTDACFLLALLAKSEAERVTAVHKALENLADYGEVYERYGIWFSGDFWINPEVKLRLTNDLNGFYLYAAEVLQENGEVNRAVKLLENSGLLHSKEIQLSLGELYYRAERFDRTIRLFQGMEGGDAPGTIASLLLGMAFRQKGLTRAAVETLRKARRRTRNRPQSLILEARYQLGITLEMEGKKHLARREYEKILSEDFDYQNVRERLFGQ